MFSLQDINVIIMFVALGEVQIKRIYQLYNNSKIFFFFDV